MNSIKFKAYQIKHKLAPYLPLRFPVHVDVELAGKCQLACTMCPYGTGDFDKSKQGMMPLDMAREVLQQARAGGSHSVKLNFRGEPGLSKNITHCIHYAKRTLKFTEVIINTNLTAFTAQRVRDICHAGLDLCIVSIDGATRETYEKIRVNGDFDKLLKNLRVLNSNIYKPKIRLQMVVQEENRHEIEAFELQFSDLCDEIVFQEVRDRGAGEGFEGERTRCPQPWQRLVVAWDGRVFACCGNWDNEYSLGWFQDMTLKECWDSDAMENLRGYATNFNCFPCKQCTVGSSYK